MKKHNRFFLILNVAIFKVMALVHLLILITQTPITIAGVTIPLHVSAVAMILLFFMAWENWQMIKNKSSKTIAKLLSIIFVADGFLALVAFAMGIEFLGFSGNEYIFGALFDFAIAAGLWRYVMHHK